MKRRAVLFFVLVLVVAVNARSQDAAVEKGRALAESKRCALCHKEGGMAEPMKTMAEGKTDELLRQAIVNPKEALGPETKMPAYSFNEEELEALIEYMRFIAD